jgi:amino acid transporter
MAATFVVVLGLNALGATDRLMAFGAIVVLIAMTVAGWFIPEDSPPDRR